MPGTRVTLPQLDRGDVTCAARGRCPGSTPQRSIPRHGNGPLPVRGAQAPQERTANADGPGSESQRLKNVLAARPAKTAAAKGGEWVNRLEADPDGGNAGKRLSPAPVAEKVGGRAEETRSLYPWRGWMKSDYEIARRTARANCRVVSNSGDPGARWWAIPAPCSPTSRPAASTSGPVG
jgi:hypothetical protein